MNLWEHYFTPSTLEEAYQLLESHGGKAQVIGGGTDLLLDIKQGHVAKQAALVDVTHIPELRQITQSGDSMTVGAGVTHSQIVNNALLASQATCLVESCGVVGGPQVRNVGTLGGNVAHALPAADGTTSLIALDAEAEVLIAGERLWLPLGKLFKGPGQSLLDPYRDILVQFRFKLSKTNEASAFKRIMRPQGVALPILGCAVWVELDDDQTTLSDVRICIGPVAPIPTRASTVEEVLRGSAYSDRLLEQAVATARADLKPRTSKYRATAEYRVEMIEVLLRRALPLAFERARTGKAIPEGVGLQ